MLLNDFIVLSSPYNSDDETKVCYVVIDTYGEKINAAEFADYLQEETPLQVNSIAHLTNFFYTYAKIYKAAVLEVQLTTEITGLDIPCEVMAVSATYMYMKRKQHEIEDQRKL